MPIYALTNDIYIGSVNNPTYHFQNSQISLNSPSGTFALDVIGNELSIDTFTVTVRMTEDDLYDALYDSLDSQLFDSTDDELYALVYADITTLRDFLQAAPYGTPVWWYVSGSFYVKGYLKSIDRVSKYGFKLTCTSGVGLLDTVMHSGGLYSNTPITTVLSSIVNGAFSYTVSAAVQASTVYGHLPYDTARNNLHRLLFATGAALQKGSSSNDYVIDYLGETVTAIPSSRIALQGSVEYQLPSNRVEITEHAFFESASQPTETLFDNTAEVAALGLLVVFDAPVVVSTLATTGTLTVNSSGVNFAVVSGVGTLTGKYYTHTTQVDVLENNPDNEPLRVRRVTDNELITALNARNVARRVLSYYQSAKQVKAKILCDAEKCGKLYQFTDSFGELTRGYMAKMDTLITSVKGANCTLIEGFEPGSGGNNFLHRQEIKASGTFTVPNDIPIISNGKGYVRLVLIQGGTGGQGGYDGSVGLGQSDMIYSSSTGSRTYGYRNGENVAQQGGNPGAAGTQGKVYVIEMLVAPGEVITWNIGVGGAGGARNGGAGSAGTHTTASSTNIGTVSSASGNVLAGFFDPMTGNVFASPGDAGVTGGDGGAAGGVNGFSGSGTAGTYNGGAGGAGASGSIDEYSYGMASGGGGGGGAYGALGNNGGAASIYNYYPMWVQSGNGGTGADALAPAQPTYGNGGTGGNGGGAGGNAGGCATYVDPDADYYDLRVGAAGVAGHGSVGGQGGDGLGIVYW